MESRDTCDKISAAFQKDDANVSIQMRQLRRMARGRA
jgi:hypothetical protein